MSSGTSDVHDKWDATHQTFTMANRLYGWLERNVRFSCASPGSDPNFVTLTDVLNALKNGAPKIHAATSEEVLKESIKRWMTGKGAQFKKTFRVDTGSGRTSSSSGAKKGNIFVGAKLVEVCDDQNA